MDFEGLVQLASDLIQLIRQKKTHYYSQEGDAAAQPTHLLLQHGVDIWRELIELLVAQDGFPQEED